MCWVLRMRIKKINKFSVELVIENEEEDELMKKLSLFDEDLLSNVFEKVLYECEYEFEQERQE